jgi:hypothetical protein
VSFRVSEANGIAFATGPKPVIRLEGRRVRWHWYFSALALAGGACLAGYAVYVWRRRRVSAGTCQVVSAPGMGTTVELWLPISSIG